MRTLLERDRGGWVPDEASAAAAVAAPDTADGSGAQEPDAEGGAARDRRADREPAWAPDAGSGPAADRPRVAPPAIAPRPGGGSDQEPDRLEPAPSAISPRPEVGVAQEPDPLEAAPVVPRTARTLHLPTSLAASRLDPGRRGATALVVAALLAALVTGLVVLRGRPQEVAVPDVVVTGAPLPGVSPAASDPAAPAVPAAAAGGAGPLVADVVVAVAGEVVRPGLVRLPPGSRVDDAVRAAGGPLPGAGTGLLNLARVLVDGEQVLVGVDPPPGAAPPPGAVAGGGAPGPAGPLDLNLATAADLDALPGIGPVLAQRIVDWRSEHGRFASVEQLREVTGIGESKYADLEPKVTV